MSEAEHRKPCESRGSRTVLGARGGEIPSRDSPASVTAIILSNQLEVGQQLDEPRFMCRKMTIALTRSAGGKGLAPEGE